MLEIFTNSGIVVSVHCGHHSNATPCQLFILADRFKDINFICGHSGSTDFKMDAVESCKLLDNYYLESSLAQPSFFAGSIPDIGENKAIMGIRNSERPLKKVCDKIRQIRSDNPGKRIEVWFQDEARFGQQGTLTRQSLRENP